MRPRASIPKTHRWPASSNFTLRSETMSVTARPLLHDGCEDLEILASVRDRIRTKGRDCPAARARGTRLTLCDWNLDSSFCRFSIVHLARTTSRADIPKAYAELP